MGILNCLKKFTSYISPVLGMAFSSTVEAFVGKASEQAFDRYIRSEHIEKESCVVNNYNYYVSDNRQIASVGNSGAMMENSQIPLIVIHDFTPYCYYGEQLKRSLENLDGSVVKLSKDGVFSSFETLVSACPDNPLIFIELSRDVKNIYCRFTVHKIVPGIMDCYSLKLVLANQFQGNKAKFDSLIVQNVSAITILLCNFIPFYREPLISNNERLKLEMERLDGIGYKNIPIRDFPQSGGYILDLSINHMPHTIWLSYDYPNVAPQIFVNTAKPYEITFANNCWSSEHTISQLVLALEKGYGRV